MGFIHQPLILANAFAQVWSFFVEGGFFMYLLAATSLVAVTVIIWRAMALRRERVIPAEVETAVSNFMPENDRLERLVELLRRSDSPFSRIVLQACRQFNWTKSENLTALQTRARKEIHHLEQGLTVLEIIVGIAPLLGLLGTVSGLVRVFGSIGFDGADPTTLAAGIAEALNTTIAGLAVAIPSLIAHNIFTKRVEWLSVDMETNIEGLLAKCYHEPYEEQGLPGEGAIAGESRAASLKPAPAAAKAGSTSPNPNRRKH
jgi:biopolymer transport protein ExbB